ncbi:MAG TPA: DUF5106 domain-containing protein, partial [Saprospiraceae bacterium]|nr:DUF5106 domain-containing protein [Saprospiraceae bacterium]
LLVLKPDNSFIQFFLTESNQELTLTTDAKLTTAKMKVKGSDDNTLFYDYMRFLSKQRPEADTLRAQLGRAKGNPKDSTRLAQALTDIDKRVKKYQQEMLDKHPGTMTAKIIKASFEPEVPEFAGPENDTKIMKRRAWYWQHFFDNLDLGDPCLMRSPVLHPKVDQFVQKFAVQHPDSISQAIDYVMGKMKSNPDAFRYFLVHFLNYYAKSNIVGMDGVYVHIAKKYYCTGAADWVKQEDVEKICDNASRLEPILIGKIAPNIVVMDRNNQPSALWDVDADYTVLFFWDPDCSHCKKAAPNMVSFASKFKDRGVKVFAVCTAVNTEKEPNKGAECWKSIEEKGFSDFLFLNTWDPYLRSRYKTTYDIKTTPQIFILDRKHEILMKRIGAEQLESVMEEVMKFQQEKKNRDGGKQ